MALKGIIRGVRGVGGLLTLDIELPSGSVVHLHGDNGPTVRALDAVYGGVIVPGHGFDASHLVGMPIEFDVDEMMPMLINMIYPIEIDDRHQDSRRGGDE